MQLSFEESLDPVKRAYDFGTRSDGDQHGVVLTKPHIVAMILDLCGYTANRNLSELRILEPSCGEGAFLVEIVTRLLNSREERASKVSIDDAVLAFDIDATHVDLTRKRIATLLTSRGFDAQNAKRLAARWVVCGDFLLDERPGSFDFVVGNPPYVRIEQIEAGLQARYRRRFQTIFDRADLYVAFIENGLSLLSETGRLGFVCADRWTLNRYGEPLRRLISDRYSVESFVDLHDASPFESEVIAYPAIFVLGRGPQCGNVPVVKMTTADESECRSMTKAIVDGKTSRSVARYKSWFAGGEAWVMSSPAHLAVLRELEARLPLMEDAGARVRIGVATGCDAVFIVPSSLSVEPDRLMPLVRREDLVAGKIHDGKMSVINTFNADGVVDLADFPRLRAYFEANGPQLRRRHVAKNSKDWFRTIDRVYPDIVNKPKLLIPDIAGSNQIVMDDGKYFPHHNLYYVLSDVWDLDVLGALLSSKVALFFVWSYAVKMRGGYLRFQAQYLRKIRVPTFESVPTRLRRALAAAFRAREFSKLDELALEAYGLAGLPAFEFVDTRS